MSKGCYKAAYGRKVNGPANTPIQFDKLLCESSNKPTASKSTGTVGKWGITSFTSIRSGGFTVGKRQRDKPKKDAFGGTMTVNSVADSPTLPKPKKFFKSRATEEQPKHKTTVQPPPRSPPAPRQYIKNSNRPTRQASIAAAQKIINTVDGEEDDDDMFQGEAMNLSRMPLQVPPLRPLVTSPPSTPKEDSAQHPPIVLRIFKGTSQLLTEEEVAPVKKEGRRRSHGSDSNDSVSPRRHRSKSRDTDPIKKENIAPEDEDMDKCMKESEHLLASTENYNQKIIKLEAKPTAEDLIRVLEGDSAQSPLEYKEEMEDIHIKEENQNDQWTTDKPHINNDLETKKPNSDNKVEPLVLRRPVTKPPKKGSIFKSRATSGEKRNAPRYIHNWSDQKDEAAKANQAANPKGTRVKTEFDADFEDANLQRVTNYPTGEEENDISDGVTSVTCSKKAKEYYTVVRNVKKAHQIQESGEFQEFNDDVEYILDALQDNNPISTRCLSAITLASKCMVPAFRMHVRAHGTVTKFFRALHDATKDQRLGMCTATVMFVLSQDRLNVDVDRDSLELMLNLLESDASHSSALEGCGLSDSELAKTKDRVRSLCQEIQEHGNAKHLNLDNITVGQLAMETLLSLTSKRAGEWFKEELRDLGGLEHIIKTIVDTCRPIEHSITEWNPQLLDRLRKADRCLKVLENVTHQNEENNHYILTYSNGMLVDTAVRILSVCDRQVPFYPTNSNSDKESTGYIIKECLLSNLKVLINLTNDFNKTSFGSTLAGKKEGIIQAALHILLLIPMSVPDEQKFDVIVLALILLINLVEHCTENRKLLIDAKAPPDPDLMFTGNESAVSALVKLFMKHEELARTEERKTDAILDGEKQEEIAEKEKKSHEEFIEETVSLLLQKAGKHMEHTLVGAYIALLLGYLTVANDEFELFVRGHMPNNNYATMLSVLQKFFNFMTLTSSAGSASSRGIKATDTLIKQLTEIDSRIKTEQT